MRILGEPDKEFEPRNRIEEKICSMLKGQTGEDIARFYAREEYSRTFFDVNGVGEDPGFDFIVMTSKKHKDWYCGGLEFGVNVAGDEISINELGSWNV